MSCNRQETSRQDLIIFGRSARSILLERIAIFSPYSTYVFQFFIYFIFFGEEAWKNVAPASHYRPVATDGELSYGSVMTVDLLSLSDYVDVYRRRYIDRGKRWSPQRERWRDKR